MKLYIMAVRDRQIQAYMQPFFAQAKGQAIRTFIDEVNRQADDNILFRHPDDFELYLLGSFDSESGAFECDRADMVMAGSSAKLGGK